MAHLLNARILAFLDLINTDCGTAATCKVYTGTEPATIDITATGTLLGTLTLANPAFGSAADAAPGGTLTAGVIADDASADSSGDPGYARIAHSDTTDILQVSAGVGSGELDFLTTITAGQPMQVSSLVISMAE